MKSIKYALSIPVFLMASSLYAATCNISATNLDFGEYDLVNPLDVASTMTVSCSRPFLLPETVLYSLSLSVGGGSYSARELINASSRMYYNLYSDASRLVIWGDGGAASRVTGEIRLPLGTLSGSQVHDVYGRIPGGQGDLEVGFYTSPAPIVVTLQY